MSKKEIDHRKIIVNELKRHYGIASDNELIDKMQDLHQVSDLVMSLEEIPSIDLMRAWNAVTDL